MTGKLYAVAGLCIRRRRIVLAAWIAIAIGITIVVGAAGTKYADDLSLPGKDSQAATDLVESAFPAQANGSNPVVFEAAEGRLSDPANAKIVDATVDRLRKTAGVTSVVSPLSKQGAAQVSKDGRIGYASAVLEQPQGSLDDEQANSIVDAATEGDSERMEVAVGGYLGQQVSKPSTTSSEVIGLIAAVIVLLFTFGTIVAMGTPILTAVIGLMIGLGAIGLLSHLYNVPTIGPTLATMIGLGVGIDYALFIVTRHRIGLDQGLEPEESAARAVATAGGAVVFAGSTVVVALLSLGLAGIPLVRSLGFTAAIAVVIAILAAITLLPALLGFAGRRVSRRKPAAGRAEGPDGKDHGWRRWADAVAARPVPSTVVSVVVLLVLAVPLTKLHLGQQDNGALPTSTQIRQSYDLITKGFGVGQNGPLLIAVKTAGDDSAPADVNQAVAGDRGIAAVSPPQLDESGSAAIFNAIPTTAPSARATEDTVNRLRDQVIPKALRGTGARADVGGTTAGYVDLAEEIGAQLPQVIGVVVLLSFLVLVLAFRSLVIPLQAAIMNLLSIAAAYGIVTAVFQKGWGAGLIGLEGPVPVVSFLPLVMFAILFGLSMDYEVFLLTQVREAHKKLGRNRPAVIDGLATSGRVITSAALIMVAVFSSFILNGDPVVKQFGVGLACAVAIDATVVRCLLAPSIMVFCGEANWWFPRWMERIVPKIDVEGSEFFEPGVAAAAVTAPGPPAPPPLVGSGNERGDGAHGDGAGSD